MSSPQIVYQVEQANNPAHTTVPTGAPIEGETSAMPPSSLNHLTIASIILAVCGTGFVLAAGAYTSSYERNKYDRRYTIFAVCGIACFATSVPLLACGAGDYRKKRGSQGLCVCVSTNCVCTSIAWILYVLGMAYAVIVVLIILFEGIITVPWVYFAILYNIFPFLLMMVHAEFSRRE